MTCKIVLNEQEIREIIADHFGIKNVDKVWLYLDQCEVEIADNFKRVVMFTEKEKREEEPRNLD